MTVSNERLEEMASKGIAGTVWEAQEMALELLALRKAYSEPIVWIHQTTGAMLKNSVIEEVRKQSGVWIPLYRKPTLP